MADKSEGSHVGLEIPNHHSSVSGATHDLFEVRVEAAGENALFVSLKRSF